MFVFILKVLFHPSNPETLFTASVDGLVCSLDATKPPSDEDSLQSVSGADIPNPFLVKLAVLYKHIWSIAVIGLDD